MSRERVLENPHTLIEHEQQRRFPNVRSRKLLDRLRRNEGEVVAVGSSGMYIKDSKGNERIVFTRCKKLDREYQVGMNSEGKIVTRRRVGF